MFFCRKCVLSDDSATLISIGVKARPHLHSSIFLNLIQTSKIAHIFIIFCQLIHTHSRTNLFSAGFEPSIPITFVCIRSVSIPEPASAPCHSLSTPPPPLGTAESHIPCLSTPIVACSSTSEAGIESDSTPKTPVSPLYSFGFDPKVVDRALKLTRGNEEQATNLILDGTLDTLPEDLDDSIIEDSFPAPAGCDGGSLSSVPHELRQSLRAAMIQAGVPGMDGSMGDQIFEAALNQVIWVWEGAKQLCSQLSTISLQTSLQTPPCKSLEIMSSPVVSSSSVNTQRAFPPLLRCFRTSMGPLFKLWSARPRAWLAIPQQQGGRNPNCKPSTVYCLCFNNDDGAHYMQV
jgi:hypothetical protein